MKPKTLFVLVVVAFGILAGVLAAKSTRAEQPDENPVTELLRDLQFDVATPQTQLTPDLKRALDQLGKRSSLSTPRIIEIDHRLLAIVCAHVDVRSFAEYDRAAQVLLHIDNLDLVPISGDRAIWEQVVTRTVSKGAVYSECTVSQFGDALSALKHIRQAIEHYHFSTKAFPDFSKQWTDLVNGDFLLGGPRRNQLADRNAAFTIAIVAEPGRTGAGIDLQTAGWVWNSADKLMYPAGWTEEQLEKAFEESKQSTRFSDRRRVQIKGMLGGCRAAIAGFVQTTGPNGQGRCPTVDDFNAGSVVKQFVVKVVNPFNGSSLVQAAKWNPLDPSVDGDAGWNYDAQTGKFWANSDVIGENDF